MGHKDIKATTRYLHVSPKRLPAATNPLERIPVSGPARLQRSRKLRNRNESAHRRGGRLTPQARGSLRSRKPLLARLFCPGPANTASIGLNPFQLLSLALDRMQESGLPRGKGRQGTEYFAWSAVRELALLVLEGPFTLRRRRWCWRWVSGWLSWWSVVSVKCTMPLGTGENAGTVWHGQSHAVAKPEYWLPWPKTQTGSQIRTQAAGPGTIEVSGPKQPAVCKLATLIRPCDSSVH